MFILITMITIWGTSNVNLTHFETAQQCRLAESAFMDLGMDTYAHRIRGGHRYIYAECSPITENNGEGEQ